MWYEDLSTYEYEAPDFAGPEGGGAPTAVTLNVGWLERGRAFATGDVAGAVVERLRLLGEHAPTQVMRGWHYCDLCPQDVDDDDLARSHAEIRVVGADGSRYAPPTLIEHYVTAHGYSPPRAFVDALMRVAGLSWEAAQEGTLCLGCGGPLRVEPGWPACSCRGCGVRYDR
jgi:hypothetical protein